MILKIFSCAIIFALCLSSQGAVPQEYELRQLMNEYNERYLVLQTELRNNELGLETTNLRSIFLRLARFYSDMTKALKMYQTNLIRDETLRRQVSNIIMKGFKYLLPYEDVERLVIGGINLQELRTKRDNCRYTQRRLCNIGYLPHIMSIISQSQDPNELQYYWKEWRDKHYVLALENFKEFIDIFQKAASLGGYQIKSHAWYSDYEDPDLIIELKDIMTQLQPFYKEFHAYVRHILKVQYGAVTVSETGPIPQHLLEQILVQAWNNVSILEQPFPNKPLPDLQAGLENRGYNAYRITGASAEFFESMGFTPFNRTFWNTFVQEKTPEEAGEDCKASVFVGGSVAIKYCPKTDFKKFLQMHGYMARVEYATLSNIYQIGLNEEACPGFSNAFGEAIILSASTPKHIQRMGIANDYHYDPEMSLNRLFRFGIHTVFNIPSYYINERMITDALDNQYSLSEPNCHFWKYMNEYLGVEPPEKRSRNKFDVSHKFFENLFTNHQTKKLISEILGYQIYRSLCEKSGQFVRGDPNRPLQNCDIYGNREVGNLLKRTMSLGSVRTWRDIMEMLTGERVLNAAGLLEYYEPLREWLIQQNKKNNVHVGWTESNKCE